MRKAFILICALIALLAVVSCKQDIDPNIYEYDPTSYLGAWEMNFAEADGDEDGCIHLLQINFEKDGTYSCVGYNYNAETKNIAVEKDVLTGLYEYTPATGEIKLNYTNLGSFFWTEETGLTLYNGDVLKKRYDFSRPKYVIKVAKDQSALEGVWEARYDDEVEGSQRMQFVFNADGSANVLHEDGESVRQASFSKSWKYLDNTQVKNYQISNSIKWYQGSEMYGSGVSVLDSAIHKQKNAFVLEATEIIIDDGKEDISVEREYSPYFILDYGNEKLLFVEFDNNQNVPYDHLTLVKKSQSDMIDVNKEFEPVVNAWNIYTGAPVVNPEPLEVPDYTEVDLYLKSDGTFYVDGQYLSEDGNILTPSGIYPHNGYYGTYSIDLEEVYIDSFLDSMKVQWMEYNPVIYNEGYNWAAWRNSEVQALIDQTKYSYEFYKGTLTLNPKYGGSEEFEITVCKRTELYGDNNPDGEPGDSSIILYKKGVKDYRWFVAGWGF